MKILVTGASGLLGSALIPYLKEKGHDVRPVIRSTEPAINDEVRWHPEKGFIDYKDMENVDVFINLSGDNIASDRWTEQKKVLINNSRVNSTYFLSQLIASMQKTPRLLINASAIGYYGDQGNSVLTEKSPKGDGFLANVCEQWENATDFARRKGTRVALLRFGMVLSSQGGALQAMVGPFKKGFGGRVGPGTQWWSWIAIQDLLNAIYHVIQDNDLEGPINVVSPFPVTNKQFTEELAKQLNVSAMFPLPGFLAKIVLGQMAKEVLLASQKVEPDKLIKSNFKFEYPKLAEALKASLK